MKSLGQARNCFRTIDGCPQCETAHLWTCSGFWPCTESPPVLSCVYKRKSKKGTNVFSACYESVIGLITSYISSHLKFKIKLSIIPSVSQMRRLGFKIKYSTKLIQLISSRDWIWTLFCLACHDPRLFCIRRGTLLCLLQEKTKIEKLRENLKDKKIKRNQLFFLFFTREKRGTIGKKRRKKMRNLVQKKMYMRADTRKAYGLFVLEPQGNIDFSGKAVKEQKTKTKTKTQNHLVREVTSKCPNGDCDRQNTAPSIHSPRCPVPHISM